MNSLSCLSHYFFQYFPNSGNSGHTKHERCCSPLPKTPRYSNLPMYVCLCIYVVCLVGQRRRCYRRRCRRVLSPRRMCMCACICVFCLGFFFCVFSFVFVSRVNFRKNLIHFNSVTGGKRVKLFFVSGTFSSS